MIKKTISISQIGTYTSCAYKWHVTYQRGIRVKRSDASPASLGSAFHVGMAAALNRWWVLQEYENGDGVYEDLSTTSDMAIDAWDAENRPENKQAIRIIGDTEVVYAEDIDFYEAWQLMVDNAKILVDRTLRHIDLIHTYTVLSMDVETPLIEFWIEEDIPDTDFTFVGVVDAVMMNNVTGMIEVVDWKVRGRFSGLESEQLSMQLGLYQHVLRERYGIDAVAGVTYQVKNAYPQQPKLNKPDKNGKQAMSRQGIKTDWATYRDALLLHGLDPADYIDEMQSKLSDAEFWRPLTVVRLAQVTSKLWDNMVMHTRNINGQTEFPRALGYACRFCPFQELCNAELYDHDTQALFEDKYVLAEWSTEKEDDEEEF